MLLPPPLPARSRLIALPPCGVGTARTESLTGYVARLAAAHGVSTGTLLQHELVGHIKNIAGERSGARVSLTPAYLRSMNGMDPVADTWTRLLGELTCRGDLRHLTMLAWMNVMPSRGLFREERAWCPECYACDEVVHEHLIWCLAPVTICTHHRRPLENRCPHCHESLPVISWRSVPGFCSSCRGWLGTTSGSADAGMAASVELPAWECRVAENFGELVSAAPGLTHPPGKDRIAHALEALTGCTGAGRMAGVLGVDYMASWAWSTGKMRPLIACLLPICARFGVSLMAFYTDAALQPGAPDGVIPQATDRAGTPRAKPVRRGSRHRQRALLKRAGAYLQSIVTEEPVPPPSLCEICRRTGHDKPVLYRHYPDLCRAITARWKEWNRGRGSDRRERLAREIREVALRLHAEGIVPTTLTVARSLALPGAIRDPVARSTLREIRKQLASEAAGLQTGNG